MSQAGDIWASQKLHFQETTTATSNGIFLNRPKYLTTVRVTSSGIIVEERVLTERDSSFYALVQRRRLLEIRNDFTAHVSVICARQSGKHRAR